MVLLYIKMNLPQVYMCSPSWPLLPPLSPYHPSGSSQCTSPKHPVSCIEPGLVTRFIYDIIHVSMPFSQIIPPSPSPTESKRLFYTSVSPLLCCIQGYCYHLSKFHIYALVVSFFLLLSCLSCLYILEIKLLPVTSFINSFFHSSFHFVYSFFAMQKFVSLIRSHVFNFLFISVVLGD